MKNNQTRYWICQITGWLSYGLTLIFFSYVLERQLSPVFYPRMFINILLGLSLTHLLRALILKAGIRPPMPSHQWWKILLLFFGYAILYSFLISSVFEIFKLYDAGRKMTHYTLPSFNIHDIVSEWNSTRVTKRFFISLVFDTPISLIWISVYMLWHFIEFSNSEAINKIKLESLIKELELKTIKSQINPHFIFNALNSIRALVDENPTRARQAITELSNILRSSIQVDKIEITTLEKELTIVKDYLALEYIRFDDRLHVVYDIANETLQNKVPPMMLQTLVENAIKHGLSKQPGVCQIKIISKFEQDKHILIVQNTGVLEKVEKDGFGLQSTRERLNILYKGSAEFEILQCAANQVAAKLVIPISA
ncbi:MAG: sensor histidine kinase [Sediminibacterium sp.]|jgi:two-component system LytT family sensor kinase